MGDFIQTGLESESVKIDPEWSNSTESSVLRLTPTPQLCLCLYCTLQCRFITTYITCMTHVLTDPSNGHAPAMCQFIHQFNHQFIHFRFVEARVLRVLLSGIHVHCPMRSNVQSKAGTMFICSCRLRGHQASCDR